MSRIELFCQTATPFDPTGALDEDALGLFLDRFVDAGVGVFLGSASAGEGHALTELELRRIYDVGVKTCAGRIPVGANPPEQHTARAACAHARIAMDAGVDIVNIYAPAGWHGMRPTDEELIGYFRTVLGEIVHPVTIAVSPALGYVPGAAVMADICRRHQQIVGLRLAGTNDTYLIDIKRAMDREIGYCVPSTGSINAAAIGATGVLGIEANILPSTFAAYGAALEKQDHPRCGEIYALLRRFDRHVRKWGPSHPRWIKMAMKVLRLPGGEGGLREPYIMPAAEELERFASGLVSLDIPELEDLARDAGLTACADRQGSRPLT